MIMIRWCRSRRGNRSLKRLDTLVHRKFIVGRGDTPVAREELRVEWTFLSAKHRLEARGIGRGAIDRARC